MIGQLHIPCWDGAEEREEVVDGFALLDERVHMESVRCRYQTLLHHKGEVRWHNHQKRQFIYDNLMKPVEVVHEFDAELLANHLHVAPLRVSLRAIATTLSGVRAESPNSRRLMGATVAGWK